MTGGLGDAIVWEELELSIGRILRRSAGLPDEGDPFDKQSGEARPPYFLRLVTALIVASRHGPPWQNPRAVEAELENIRNDLRMLKKRIGSLDSITRMRINVAGGPKQEKIDALDLSDEADRIRSAHNPAWGAVPQEQKAVPATLSAIGRFDAAIIKVIEQAIEESNRLPETGRIPNYAAREIAFLVALFFYDVTGRAESGGIPGLWTGKNPSGPFARALSEIFEILNIKSGIQRPGEWAISELT